MCSFGYTVCSIDCCVVLLNCYLLFKLLNTFVYYSSTEVSTGWRYNCSILSSCVFKKPDILTKERCPLPIQMASVQIAAKDEGMRARVCARERDAWFPGSCASFNFLVTVQKLQHACTFFPHHFLLLNLKLELLQRGRERG